MALSLKQLASGLFSRTLLNSNFQKIEESVNNDLLHRHDGSNVMKQDIDMDSNRLLNIGGFTLAFGFEVATEDYVDNKEVESIARDSLLQADIHLKETESIERDSLLQLDINLKETESTERDVAYDLLAISREQQIEADSLLRDSSFQNGLTTVTDILYSTFLPRAANRLLSDTEFPWDLGNLLIEVATFSNEQLPGLRVDLAQGSSFKELGTLV